MNLDWILSPLTWYAVVALALIASLVVFVVTKVEVMRLRRAGEQSSALLRVKIEQLESVLTQLANKPAQEAEALPMQVLKPSLNLTRRARVLRMYRRGESAESIAAALATPRNEVELLLKVQQFLDCRKN